MTSSEIKSNQQNQIAEMLNQVEKSRNPAGIILPLKIIEYMALAAAIGLSITAFVFSENWRLILAVAIAVGLLIFMFLVNIQVKTKIANDEKERKLTEKVILCNTNVSGDRDFSEKTPITLLVKKALRYSQEMIDDYKKTRDVARNIYYILQLSTIVLSAVTPVLVLVDKSGTDSVVLKWLPVICPAIASIVASIVTSFPFEEKWIAAEKAAELLETEQEKFLLGVSPAYKVYDIADPVERQKKLRQAIGSFIAKVNKIHLKQIEGDKAESKESKVESSNSDAQKSPEN